MNILDHVKIFIFQNISGLGRFFDPRLLSQTALAFVSQSDHTVEDVPMAGELGRMNFKGLFQPKPPYDSIIL